MKTSGQTEGRQKQVYDTHLTFPSPKCGTRLPKGGVIFITRSPYFCPGAPIGHFYIVRVYGTMTLGQPADRKQGKEAA